jgi:hypothetical protein
MLNSLPLHPGEKARAYERFYALCIEAYSIDELGQTEKKSRKDWREVRESSRWGGRESFFISTRRNITQLGIHFSSRVGGRNTCTCRVPEYNFKIVSFISASLLKPYPLPILPSLSSFSDSRLSPDPKHLLPSSLSLFFSHSLPSRPASSSPFPLLSSLQSHFLIFLFFSIWERKRKI